MTVARQIYASVIFSEKELRLYYDWQDQQANIPAERHYHLPTPYEFEEYMYWRGQVRTLYLAQNPALGPELLRPILGNKDREDEAACEGFECAAKCGHPLHPGVYKSSGEEEADEAIAMGEVVTRCPKCDLRAHMNLLVVVSERWNEIGGPWHKPTPGHPRAGFYGWISRAYHRVKVDLINLIDDFEAMVVKEQSWEQAHPDTDVTIAKKYGANVAVEMYREGISYPAHLIPAKAWEEIQEQNKGKQPATPTTKKKGLMFSPETPEETRHRSRALYARSCSTYDKASPYTCPDEEGWEDTSFLSNYEYAVRQCRILLIQPNLELGFPTYCDINEFPHKGDNREVELLLLLIKNALTAQTPEIQAAWKEALNANGMYLVKKEHTHTKEHFDTWECAKSLEGTIVEQYARMVGDIEEDDAVAPEEQPLPSSPGSDSSEDMEGEHEEGGGIDMVTMVDGWDQESLASDPEEEEEPGHVHRP